ncbi:hypothetical protein AB0M92_23790 [Streptomyces sp. NPDC051582]|uniref:hypothetical protein n=1 Tax=Streptomyces sp. NPDC051582 TaxID=3155167 RepID=UPI0034133A91
MTTAKLPVFFGRTAEEDGQGGRPHSGTVRIGKWLFNPSSADGGDTRHATLEHGTVEIDLSYSSSVFEDFLHAMSMIQVEFGRQLGTTATSATTVGGSDGCSRV